jgi:hypothetical protein
LIASKFGPSSVFLSSPIGATLTLVAPSERSIPYKTHYALLDPHQDFIASDRFVRNSDIGVSKIAAVGTNGGFPSCIAADDREELRCCICERRR